MLPVFPIDSRPGRSGSFSSTPISCDARRLPHQGSQSLRHRVDSWVAIAREVRPFDFSREIRRLILTD